MSLCSKWSDFVNIFLTEVAIWCGGVSFDGCWQLIRSGGKCMYYRWMAAWRLWLRAAQNSAVEKKEVWGRCWLLQRAMMFGVLVRFSLPLSVQQLTVYFHLKRC